MLSGTATSLGEATVSGSAAAVEGNNANSVVARPGALFAAVLAVVGALAL